MVTIQDLRQLSSGQSELFTGNEKRIMFLLQLTFLGVSFFLARAVFFEAAVPFLVPFWAIVSLRYRHLKWPTLIGGLTGALTLGLGQLVIIFLQLCTFQFLKRLIKFPLPILVMLATLLVQIAWQGGVYGGWPPLLVQFYVGCEAVLAMVMMIFLQLTLLPPHRFWTSEWTYERAGAAFFILAAMLTGMSSFTLSIFNIAIICLHLVICIAAFVGGVTLSTIVATILGTIVGMAHLSFTGMLALYALTGVFAGSSVQLGRFGIALGSILPSVFFFFYDATLPLDIVYFVSISIATLLSLLINRSVLEKLRALFYPKRDEVLLKRQEWLTNHMTQTIEQFQQFVFFMKDLVFDRFTEQSIAPKKIQPCNICQDCFRHDRCWGEKQDMAEKIAQYYRGKTSQNPIAIAQAEEILRLRCIKSDKLLQELEYLLYNEQMNNQLFHGKKMIALQLQDVSHHLNRLLQQMQGESVSFESLECELLERLQSAQLNCFQIDVLSNEVGQRRIVCSVTMKNMDQATELSERIILPILYERFAEPFYVERITYKEMPFPYVEVRARSSVRFSMEQGIYSRAKHNTSGDAHELFPIHDGLMAVMLSDGMGKDQRARKESDTLIRMLRECLTYNMDPETAMHTIHYVMSLKHDRDLYATIDFALIDLQHGSLWSWKAGGIATYVLRGDDVLKIEGNAAPVGLMPTFSIETETIRLKADDIVIMASDGLFDGALHWHEQERHFFQLLKKKNKQQLATDVLLYDVMEQYKQAYDIQDDCTVIACKIKHINPKWSVLNLV
ncbi:SpoIIE family protein phosphatase [Lysinibacillus sp. LZ02]|uniref:SpoIIE family protein phosphatase n=1 Tax=Lysinibacillus sp. LZ02 TaxID=3420668 RepID=UPI003D359E9F